MPDEQKIQQIYVRLKKVETELIELQIDLKRLKDVIELHLQIHPIISKEEKMWRMKEVDTKYLPLHIRLRWAWAIIRGKIKAENVPIKDKK